MRRFWAALFAVVPVVAGCKTNEGASTAAPASAQPAAASATPASTVTAAAATAAAGSAGTPLAKGVQAPDFRLEGSDGKMHALADHVGKQAVVVAWFPKAFTSG
jgi:ABC-type sulfate transport system permease component